MAGAWVADILGEPFEQLTLDLGEDAEGPVVATLVRSLPHAALLKPLADVDVLYVHGWSDYFFQRELARFWNHLGARFYALDLRKYGRSLRAGQTPGYVTSLDEYDGDIGAALAAIAATGAHRGARRLVLMGHSTGGLTLSLWAARHPGQAAALVLNSPWLELQTGAIGRQAIAPLVAARARFDPLGAHPVVDLGFYTRAQAALGTLPESPTDPQPWRPARGFPTHPGWLAAVMKGHASVAAGLEIDWPVLILLSRGSTPPVQWADAMTSTDSVLVVDDIARAATRLGGLVTVARIPDAIHDVFLSAPEATSAAYDALREWSLRGALA
ncbi:MAG: alpha/beta hydrolase [Microbacterium sp.]|nr:MAG: alpha/beta hydrolase [Microbacterium sp.]